MSLMVRVEQDRLTQNFEFLRVSLYLIRMTTSGQDLGSGTLSTSVDIKGSAHIQFKRLVGDYTNFLLGPNIT